MRFNRAGMGLGILLALVSSASEGPARHKESAAQYYGHAQLERGASVGADFLGKYLPLNGLTVYSDEYIYVDLAFFGPAGQPVDFANDQFILAVNGQRLVPQAPGLVKVENDFAEMVPRPVVVGVQGPNNGEIEIGGPERKPRFPGDDPAHIPARIPSTPVDPSNGQVQRRPVDAQALVRESQFPAGKQPLPVSGFLIFSYEGKLKKIKKAELIYRGPLGQATIALR